MSIFLSGRMKPILSGLTLAVAIAYVPATLQARTCGVMSNSFHCLTGVNKAQKTVRKVRIPKKARVAKRTVSKPIVVRKTKKASRPKRARHGKIHTIGRRIDTRSVRQLSRRSSVKKRRSSKRHSTKKLHRKLKKSAKKGWRTRSKGLGFKTARRGISTSCFPARLKKLLRQVSAHYGRKLVITSGFRSRRHNRRVGGASRSQHIHCTAADFYVPGVNKYALARYLKKMSGRGGVGTYSGNRIVHLDVGPRRTWHWGSKKRSKRRYSKKRRVRKNRRASSRSRTKRSNRRHASKSWKARFRGAQG